MTPLQRLRADSPIERLVARALSRRRERFVRQFQVGPFRGDFYLPRLNLVLECDGAFWHGHPAQAARDRRRDAFIHSRGYRVVRLRGSAIARDADGLVGALLRGPALRRHPATERAPAGVSSTPRARLAALGEVV